jgi:hypothetical protein
MSKLANKATGQLVLDFKPFEGYSISAKKIGNYYIIFSYGKHWIMYFWDGNDWIGCSHKYSVTTSKHTNFIGRHLSKPVSSFVKQNELQKLYHDLKWE